MPNIRGPRVCVARYRARAYVARARALAVALAAPALLAVHHEVGAFAARAALDHVARVGVVARAAQALPHAAEVGLELVEAEQRAVGVLVPRRRERAVPARARDGARGGERESSALHDRDADVEREGEGGGDGAPRAQRHAERHAREPEPSRLILVGSWRF